MFYRKRTAKTPGEVRAVMRCYGLEPEDVPAQRVKYFFYHTAVDGELRHLRRATMFFDSKAFTVDTVQILLGHDFYKKFVTSVYKPSYYSQHIKVQLTEAPRYLEVAEIARLEDTVAMTKSALKC